MYGGHSEYFVAPPRTSGPQPYQPYEAKVTNSPISNKPTALPALYGSHLVYPRPSFYISTLKSELLLPTHQLRTDLDDCDADVRIDMTNALDKLMLENE